MNLFTSKNASGGIFVEVEDQWAPRLSAVYDLTGDGTSKSLVQERITHHYKIQTLKVGNETTVQGIFLDWDVVEQLTLNLYLKG